jgi:hypothetical protein
LLHNTQRKKDITRLNKLTFKWLGSYRVVRANLKIGSYVLAELDDAEFNGIMIGNRLKLFYLRAKEFSVTLPEESSEHYNTVKA